MEGTKMIIVICAYLVAVSINLMPALKYPDLNVNIFNLVGSLLFLTVFFLYARKGNQKLAVFSMIGMLSGIIVFLITTFESFIFEYAILDVIASIQYPLYLIFTTPLFGGNLLIGVNYEVYSLLTSLFYLIVYVIVKKAKKPPIF